MNTYTYKTILEHLLEDAIKDLPDDNVLKTGLTLMDKDGFKHTIIKIGKLNNQKVYKLRCDKEIKIVDQKEIQKFKRV